MHKSSNGYWKLAAKNHPLSNKKGDVYLHRKIAYDAGISMSCHICNKAHTWETACIDHLDENKENNDIGNLAIACRTCNAERSRKKINQTKRANGVILSDGVRSMCKAEWARELGIKPQAFDHRVKMWGIPAALLTPKYPKGQKHT